MSTGGIFQLITNDGRQDRMLMGTNFLNQRLANIARLRDDGLATLADIEKTHIIFTNAHFKPFAAIGYEYNKVRPTSGSPQLGSSVQFSIPQFGDFIHDMVLHVSLKQPTLIQTAASVSDQPAMRWCAYPGERLMRKVSFDVNGNPLDEYNNYVYNFYRLFQVQPNKQVGWDKCMGQEQPLNGFIDTPDWVNSGVAPGTSRLGAQVFAGNQTPTSQKTANLEMFIPLLFWFNKDPRLAVPSVAIPYGQRFVNIDLAQQSELVNYYVRGLSTWAAPGGSVDESVNILQTIELYINNIFVNPEIHDIFIKRIGFNLIRVHRIQQQSCSKSEDEILLQNLKWPIETLFVGMKIANYNSATAALRAQYLDVWDRFAQITKTETAQSGWEQTQVLALTPGAGTVSINAAGAITGVGTTFTTDLQVGDILVVGGSQYQVATITSNTAAQASLSAYAIAQVATPVANFTVLRPASQTATVNVQTATMDYVGIKAHGISIYQNFPTQLYNAYMPYHYGGQNIRTPADDGALMIPFNLYPGTYQPSGHINVSRAREFYINYTSSVINSSNLGNLVVVASAINFLLISDGSAILRYST